MGKQGGFSFLWMVCTVVAVVVATQFAYAQSQTISSVAPPEGSDIPFWDLSKHEPRLRRKKILSDSFEFPLSIGEAKIIRMPFRLGSYTLVNTEMIKLKAFPNLKDSEGSPRSEVALEAKKAGTTELRIYDSKRFLRFVFKISVSPHNLTQILSELKTLLATAEGLMFRIVGQRIFLDGEILIPRDITRILAVVKQYPMVVNLTRLSPDTQNRYAEEIEERIAKPGVSVRAIQGKYIFEGQVNRSLERDNIIKIAKTMIPGIYKPTAGVKEAQSPTIVNLMTVRPTPPAPPQKVIKILLQYVELSKAYVRSFSFSWSPTIEDRSEITLDLKDGLKGTITGTIRNLFPKLARAVSLDHARLLKTITVLVKDNAKSPASIVTGIDVPFVSGQTEAGDNIINFKQVNTKFAVSAKILDKSRQIQLGVDVGINELVGGNNAQSTTNQIKTEVLLNKGQSGAIGGFFNETLRRGFGQNPAANTKIFDMDKTRNFTHGKSRFIIFLTPEVITGPEDMVEASKEFKRKFRLVREI